MNDHDIATIVRSAKLEPRPGELEQIRQRIVDDAAGIHSVGDETMATADHGFGRLRSLLPSSPSSPFRSVW